MTVSASPQWSEEEIAALIDGAIEDPDQGRRLREILAADPAAAAYAARLQRLNAAAQAAFAAPLNEPTPARITAAIFGAPDKIATFPRQRRQPSAEAAEPASPPAPRWRKWAAPAAIAAAIALTVNLGGLLFGGWFADDWGQRNLGDPTHLGVAALDGPLHGPLERAASGELSEDGVRPSLTFRAADGRPCREFEIERPNSDKLELGVACRSPEGRWRVEAMAYAPLQTPETPSGGGYSPASGATGGATFEGVLDALGAGPALTPDEEAALLSQRWTVAQP